MKSSSGVTHRSVGLRRCRALTGMRQPITFVVFGRRKSRHWRVFRDDRVRRVWTTEGRHDEAWGNTHHAFLAALCGVNGHAACVRALVAELGSIERV